MEISADPGGIAIVHIQACHPVWRVGEFTGLSVGHGTTRFCFVGHRRGLVCRVVSTGPGVEPAGTAFGRFRPVGTAGRPDLRKSGIFQPPIGRCSAVPANLTRRNGHRNPAGRAFRHGRTAHQTAWIDSGGGEIQMNGPDNTVGRQADAIASHSASGMVTKKSDSGQCRNHLVIRNHR